MENVVVGKIFSRRTITREMLRLNLARIFRARGNAEIELVGNNIFIISFSMASDRRRVLDEGPWHFFQDMMIIKQARTMETPSQVEFNEISLWVQCHNVPLDCMTPTIVRRIGEHVGKVEEIDVGEGGNCVGKFARVRVTKRIDEPLVRCVPLLQEGPEKEVIVILQYERLPDFCFFCGRVGHISRDCPETSLDKRIPRFESWLRAGNYFAGRRAREGGLRGGSRTLEVEGSVNRWDVDRNNVRATVVGSGKEGLGEDEGSIAVGRTGEEMVGVRVLEETSYTAPDLCMREVVVQGVLRCEREGGESPPKGRSGEAEREVFLGEDSGGRDATVSMHGSEKLSMKGRGVVGKSGAKKWKRLVREQIVGSSTGSGRGVLDGGKVGRPKRRGTMLRDEGEDSENKRQSKVQKGLNVGFGDVSTAVVAMQPRRAL